MLKLNLGGGKQKKEGYINIDIVTLPSVDIVHDLNNGIPFEDDTVDEVYSQHFLEHLPDTVKIMEEIYRVCKKDALVRIKVPYFKSIGAFKDPTHVSFFTERTFEYFDPTKIGELPEYNIKANFRTLKLTYIWSNKLIRFIPFKRFLLKYLWNIARTMYVELRVIK